MNHYTQQYEIMIEKHDICESVNYVTSVPTRENMKIYIKDKFSCPTDRS